MQEDLLYVESQCTKTRKRWWKAKPAVQCAPLSLPAFYKWAPPPKKACHVKARFIMSTHFQCSFTRDILGCCATSQLSLSNKSLSTFSPSLLYRSVSSSSSSQWGTVVFCLLVLGALILFVDTLSLQGACSVSNFLPFPILRNSTSKTKQIKPEKNKSNGVRNHLSLLPNRSVLPGHLIHMYDLKVFAYITVCVIN